jgi:hypothetical protein
MSRGGRPFCRVIVDGTGRYQIREAASGACQIERRCVFVCHVDTKSGKLHLGCVRSREGTIAFCVPCRYQISTNQGSRVWGVSDREKARFHVPGRYQIREVASGVCQIERRRDRVLCARSIPNQESHVWGVSDREKARFRVPCRYQIRDAASGVCQIERR